jgi:AcrR family transcriptional regulator
MSHLHSNRIARSAAAASTGNLRKSDRTRLAILEGALELLWSRPFRDLTVAQLMATAGVSRSAFYRYFDDLSALMEALLLGLQDEIFSVASPWFSGEGDPVESLREGLAGQVRVCFEQGPILRAVADAAANDERLERAWADFLTQFDDAVAAQIEAQQAQGIIAAFDARPVAVALNRMDASMLIHAFGRHPRQTPDSVLAALTRVWVSALYPSSITRTGLRS